jgi:hypothetical protein
VDAKRSTLLPRGRAELRYPRIDDGRERKNFVSAGFGRRALLRLDKESVLSTLCDAMTILREAVVLIASPAGRGKEALEMLLLAELQTRRINDPIKWSRARA